MQTVWRILCLSLVASGLWACSDDYTVDTSVCQAPPADAGGCASGQHAQANADLVGACVDEVSNASCGDTARTYWQCKVAHPTCVNDATGESSTNLDCSTERTAFSDCTTANGLPASD